MRKLTILLAATVAGLSLARESAAQGDGIAAWPVDPHVKVFRDLEPPEASGTVTLRAARNEYEPAQIAIRAKKPLEGEFWYYICCHPFGNVYPNRFLDYPTSSVRVLHWINFGADLEGYLHWGLNFWPDDPFGPPPDRLPPGDTHTIYPGPEGPLSSIRWEIQRESLEDYEYLALLAAKTADVKDRLGAGARWVDPRRRALELCRRVVPRIAETERDPARIMAARGAVAREIIALEQPPLLLVQTEPPAGATLVNGPIVVEVRGVCEPGATVKVNGRNIETRDDGRFACTASPSGAAGQITVEAQLDGKRKATARRFQVRR